FIAPVFAPLGFGRWQAAVASITGLLAKENIVASFGIFYGIGDMAKSGGENLTHFTQDFTSLSAYSFMIFNLLCAPCFAAMGAIRQEMSNPRWTAAAIAYMTVFSYVVSLIVYQIGLFVSGGKFGAGTAAAIILLVLLFYLMCRKNPYAREALSR
ncbi:MAG: ferrous iron transporter B, partial [Clostridiales bacterium]|nr:ferrous iron transporter B [Clostridiales bacterium]